MNEDSRGLRRNYKGRNYVPSPKTSYMEANTQRTKKQTIMRKKTTPMRLEHEPCAPTMRCGLRAWKKALMRLGHAGSVSKLIFAIFKWKSPLLKLKLRWKPSQ